MRKNYSRKVLAAIMLLLAGMSLTSCDEVKDFFTFDNPDGDSTPKAELTVTSNGATFTINTLADVTSFLDQVKAKINEKAGNLYTIDITANSTLATTSSDNTITLPALTAGYNIKINLKSNLNTAAAPLTIKQAGTANDPLKNNIEVNFLNNDVDLVLNMPGTQVKLNNANSLRMFNGVAKVKDGGAIKTYVYGAEKNTDQIYYSHWIINSTDYYGVVSMNKEFTLGDETKENIYEIQQESGMPYFFQNVKIVKGTADYSRISCGWSEHPLEKLTIAADAYAILNYYPCIKTIEGEGDGTAKLGFDSWWWDDTTAKTCAIDGALYNVNSISNLTIAEWLPDDVDGTVVRSSIYGVPAAENITFKMAYVLFRDPESTSATVKNCKFESPSNNKRVNIVAPYQSDEITAFKFTFESCEFAKECQVYADLNTSKPKYDAAGNPVTHYEYNWWVTDGTNWWTNSTTDESQIPAGLSETSGSWIWDGTTSTSVRSTGYWKYGPYQDYEEVTFDNYYVTTAFNSCKYDGAALTNESEILSGMYTKTGVYYRFEIDGVTYKALLDPDTNKWILIPA